MNKIVFVYDDLMQMVFSLSMLVIRREIGLFKCLQATSGVLNKAPRKITFLTCLSHCLGGKMIV